MVRFHFDPVNRIITVLAPDTEVTLQDLINAIREWEESHLEYDKVAEAAGKDFVAPGLYTAITLKLLNWRLKFEDRDVPTACLVRGGNLLAVDENGEPINPIAPANNVTVTIAQSTAASLLEAGLEKMEEMINDIKSEIEKLMKPKAHFRAGV